MSTSLDSLKFYFTRSLVSKIISIGLLLGIGTIIPTLQFLVIVGCVGFMHFAATAKSWKHAAWFGFGSWTIKSLLALWWFWSVYPIATVSIDSSLLQIVIICFSWVVSATALGVGGVFTAMGISYLYRQSHQLLIVLSAALLWVGSEMFGSFIFSLVTSGPGSYIQMYFSFGYIGYQALIIPGMTGLATLGGVYILSAAGVVISGVLLLMIQRRTIVTGVSIIGLLIVVGAVLQPAVYTASGITIAAIDTSYPAGYDEDVRAESLAQAVIAAQATKSDFILLPEDSRYLDRVFNDSSRTRSQLQYTFRYAGETAVIIDSARTTTEDGEVVLRASLFTAEPGIYHEVDKQYLVPQGEFIPYAFRFIMGISGFGETLQKNQTIGQFVPGPYTASPHVDMPSILFCMESVRPTGVMSLHSPVPFVAHPISHAWFRTPITLWPQLDQMVKIQSLWSGLSIVSAANMAPGRVYYPDGTFETAPAVATGSDWVVRFITL